jgi:hypothetical protein
MWGTKARAPEVREDRASLRPSPPAGRALSAEMTKTRDVVPFAWRDCPLRQRAGPTGPLEPGATVSGKTMRIGCRAVEGPQIRFAVDENSTRQCVLSNSPWPESLLAL